MERTQIGELSQAIGQRVKIQGWLQTLRDQKKMQFLVVRDASGSAQVVFEKNADAALAELDLQHNARIGGDDHGMVVANPVVKLGGLEIQLESLRVNSLAATPLPLDPSAADLPALDYRLDWRFLDLRRPENLLMFKVQTSALMAMREFWVQA